MAAERNTTTRDRNRAKHKRTKGPCALCGEAIDYTLGMLAGQHGPRCRGSNCNGCIPHPMRFEIDHIIPLDKGGPDEFENTQPSHRSCNRDKSNKLPDDDTTTWETLRRWW